MYYSSTGPNTHLTRAAWQWNLSSPSPPRAVINTGKNCGPSVAADGDLWMVYKLQSWNQKRCPKYVIQIDQSGWWAEHYLVQILGLTNLPWWMGPLLGDRFIFFSPFSDSTTALTFSRLDSDIQGQFYWVAIWYITKCFAIIIFYHLIFVAQNRFWASDLLICLK